jgi:hypothetical protein
VCVIDQLERFHGFGNVRFEVSAHRLTQRRQSKKNAGLLTCANHAVSRTHALDEWHLKRSCEFGGDHVVGPTAYKDFLWNGTGTKTTLIVENPMKKIQQKNIIVRHLTEEHGFSLTVDGGHRDA